MSPSLESPTSDLLAAARPGPGEEPAVAAGRVKASSDLWRQTVLDELMLLADERARLGADVERDRGGDVAVVDAHLRDALTTVDPKREPVGVWRRPLAAWRRHRTRVSGATIEAAWADVHAARLALYPLYSDARMHAEIPALREALDTYLGSDPTRATAYRTELQRIQDAATLEAADREALRALRRAADVASDLEKQDVRAYGSLLMRCSGWLLVAALAAAAAHACDTQVFSLCRTGVAPAVADRCVSGTRSPHWFDLLAVEGVGAIGGLLSGILPLSRSRRKPGPWGVSGGQIALKATTGAMIAFLGLLFMQSDLFTELPPRSGTSLLAYAGLFGLAQQIITSRADRFADDLGTNADGSAKKT